MNHSQAISLSDTTLAVLAGGQSRRMGLSKARLRLENRPVLSRLLDRLDWPGPTLLVTTPGQEHPPGYERFSAEAVDPIAGQGPMRGILTALQHAATAYVVALPVDMPMARKDPLAWLVDRLDASPEAAAVMIGRGKDPADLEPEPLPIALRVALATPLIEQRIAAGKLALKSLALDHLVHLEPCPAEWPDDLWMNLNSPDDLESFRSSHPEGESP